MVKSISILGCTGSIGRQTIAVAEHIGMPVAALTANRKIFRFWKPTAPVRPTHMAKPSWQWKRCSIGLQRHMVCGMFLSGISTLAVQIRLAQSVKHTIRKAT